MEWPRVAIFDTAGVGLYRNSIYSPILLLKLPFIPEPEKLNILAEIKDFKLQEFCNTFCLDFPKELLDNEKEETK